jgi:hypothetical protein
MLPSAALIIGFVAVPRDPLNFVFALMLGLPWVLAARLVGDSTWAGLGAAIGSLALNFGPTATNPWLSPCRAVAPNLRELAAANPGRQTRPLGSADCSDCPSPGGSGGLHGVYMRSQALPTLSRKCTLFWWAVKDSNLGPAD